MVPLTFLYSLAMFLATCEYAPSGLAYVNSFVIAWTLNFVDAFFCSGVWFGLVPAAEYGAKFLA